MRHATNPQAIHETIDGETIVIDLATGTYYSLRGCGAEIWGALVEGASADAVVARLVQRTDADAATIEHAVGGFLADLERQGLIVPQAEAPVSPAPAPDADAERTAFEPPILETYDDMQDILLLDPVHEVESTGWPHTAADASR